MKSIKTKNYLQKFICNKLFNKRTSDYLRLFKAIVFYKIRREYEFSNFLPKFILNNDVIFDIGANIGYYACRFNKLVNQGKVFSFEPVKTNFELLTKMKQILKLNRVSLYNLAIGDHTGRESIFIPVLKDSGISVETQASFKWDIVDIENAYLISEEVDIDTIDNLMIKLDLNKLDIIKCDTEGNEINVLKGGYNTINKYKPLLLLEIDPQNENLKEWYQMGYSPYYVKNNKFVSVKNVFTPSSLVVLLHVDKKILYENLL